MSPRGKRKKADEIEDTAPVVEESIAPDVVLPGDVYNTTERIVAVIVAIAGDDALVAYSPSPAQAVVTGWDALKKGARRIRLAVCSHHVECGNWAINTNIEHEWKK